MGKRFLLASWLLLAGNLWQSFAQNLAQYFFPLNSPGSVISTFDPLGELVRS